MAISNLNSYEKDLLLSLSYLDIPEYIAKAKPEPSIKNIMDNLQDPGQNKKGTNSTRYKKIKEYLDQNPDSPLKNLKLVGYENHNPNSGNNTGDESGLVAYAFDDGSGNGTILYRGSEASSGDDFLADWGSNAIASAGNTITQQKQADEFYKKYSASFNKTTIMGHSKGGNLTSYVYLNNLNDINDKLSAYVLNGQPIDWWGLTDEQQKALKGDKFTFNVIDGDFVSWIGFAPYVDKVIKFKDYNKGLIWPFDPHQEFSAQYDENNEHIIEEHPYLRFPIQSKLGMGLLALFETIKLSNKNQSSEGISNISIDKLPMANALINNLQRTYIYTELIIDKVIDFTSIVYNNMKAIAERVIDSLSQELSKIVNAGKDFSTKLGQFLKDIQTVVLSKLNQVKNNVSGVVNANERILVDTNRLANYENQLRQIRKRISDINDRIDNLYFKVGLFGIDNILRSDIITNGTKTMNKVIIAMQDTRYILESNERTLKNKARSI